MQILSRTVDGAYTKAKIPWLHRYTKNYANSCFRHSLVTEKKSFQADIQIFVLIFVFAMMFKKQQQIQEYRESKESRIWILPLLFTIS